MCLLGSKWQYIIGPDNGLAMNSKIAIIWTIDGLAYWRIYAPLDFNGLNDL